ncbi:hypothetical protein Tco_0854475 [Tanacetum coccineum]
METKDTFFSCSDLDEQDIQQLQKQAKILKENSLNKLNALKTTIQHLLSSNSSMYYEFKDAFHRLFDANKRTFKSVLSQNMQNLERQLNKETLHEKNSNSDLKITQDFKAYTNMESQTFKETIIQNMDSNEQCIVERARHEQELQNRLKRLNERKLQIQECKIQEVKASDASLRDKDSSGIVLDKGNDQSIENQSNTPRDESSRSRNECNDKSTSANDTDIKPSYDTKPMVEVPYTTEYNVFAVATQHSEQPKNINDTSLMEKVDSNTTPDSSNMFNNEFKDDLNADDHEDERVVLANLIAHLKLDIDENKKIQKQLRNTNTSLTHELKECKSTIEESISSRDRYLIALQTKEIELEKYKTYLNCPIENDKLDLRRKLKETLGILAQKEQEIKEGLKLKAYEIFVIKEKHDELVKQSLLTKSSYKAPKGSTYNGRPIFANPSYLKKAQSEKPCLYEIPYDQCNLSNRFSPDWEETLTLDQESRSKLNKDLVKPYDYTKQNSLYENFKPSTQGYLDQLERATQIQKNMWRKSFVKTKTNIAKNIAFLPMQKSINAQAHTELQCLYLHKVKECECLAQKLSKQTKNVSKEVYNELLRSFANLEKHSIFLELALQQDLKAQLQDKNIAIRKPPWQPIKNHPVIRQPTAYKSKRSKVTKHRSASQVDVSKKLTKPVTPHSWPQVWKSSFAKPYDVNTPGPSRKILKHVSFLSPKEPVGSNDMVHNCYLEEAKKKAQLQKEKALNTKPSVKQSARLPNTANGNNPKPRNFNQQPRNWSPSMSSRVGLKWIPIRKSVDTCYNTNDSESPLGKKLHNPNTTICANSSSLSAGWEVVERWFWMGELSLEVMSMKSVCGIFFGGLWVEELALDAMVYDDQDNGKGRIICRCYNILEGNENFSFHHQNWKDRSRDDWYGPRATMCEE